MSTDTLSIEQLRVLLQEAEARLEGAKQVSSQALTSLPSLREQDNSLAPCVISTKWGVEVKPSYIIKAETQKRTKGSRLDENAVTMGKTSTKDDKSTAGLCWYDMPRTVVTPELKRDLQLLANRSVLNPHRHYKKGALKHKVPEFSQVGTIIEGPTEYFPARLSNKDRKRTLVGEVLADEDSTGRFRSKYEQIQHAKTSGRREHYKKMKAMRRRSGARG